MERSERQRKNKRIRVYAGAAALAGLVIFSGFAAASTRQSQARPLTPADQLTRLQNQVGYPFWATDSGVTPPTYVQNAPQAATGPS